MRIDLERTPLAGMAVVRHEFFEDARGFFVEVFRADVAAEAGLPTSFQQVNHSGSRQNVVRGLHFQTDPKMGKLMRVVAGRAFLVAVDIRHGSPTLGQWHGIELAAEDRCQVWAPAGFARGFAVLSAWAEIEYLCTAIYNPKTEAGIRWDDPELGIRWPVTTPVLSAKDAAAMSLKEWLSRPESLAFRWP